MLHTSKCFHLNNNFTLQIQQWFTVEGERHLMEAESVEGSGERMEQILNSFTGFLIEASVSINLLQYFLFVFVFSYSSLKSLHPSSSRTAGTTPCPWCQRQRDSSRVGFTTQRQRPSRPSSALSNRTWRTSSAERRHVAESCRSWSTYVIFVSR